MFHLLRNIPFFLISFFYGLTMVEQYSLLTGIHLTFIAISVFILCTPLPALLYSTGFLPGATEKTPSYFQALFLWLAMFFLNIFTLNFKHEIYKKTFISEIFYHLLKDPKTVWTFMTLSGVSVLIHCFISRFENRKLKIVLHLIGLVCWFSIMLGLTHYFNDNLAIYVTGMSTSNK